MLKGIGIYKFNEIVISIGFGIDKFKKKGPICLIKLNKKYPVQMAIFVFC